jgi:hypothetical protein
MRSSFSRLIALVAGTAGLLTLAAVAAAQAPASESKSRFLKSYADAYGVPPEEAERRMRLQREIGRLGAQIKQNEAATYAGHYIEHKPVYRVVAKFTGNAAATLAKYTQDPLWVPEIAAVPLSELVETQSTVHGLLKGLGIESASRVDIPTGQVQFFVLDPPAVQQLITAGTLNVPSYVTFGKAADLSPQREAKVEGGRPLSGGLCTSGFTIYQTGTTNRYLTTAGHCQNTLTYNGVTLPFQNEKYLANQKYDYQWHSRGTFEQLTNVIYEGFETLLPIAGMWPYEYMEVGDWICKWGSATGWTCGGIISLTYNALGAPGFVEVHHPDNFNLSSAGDSGAPWYEAYWQEAWGSHSDSSNINPNDAFFMPMSYISVTGHAVLTSP